MADIQHAVIADPYIHEPKGVASATSGYVYAANGTGSGSWVKQLPNGASGAEAGATFRSDGAADGAWLRVEGYGKYFDDRVTVGTPTQTLTASSRTKMLCNGALGTTERLPEDASVPLWDVSLNEIKPIAIGDVLTVHASFIAESYAGASPYIDVDFDAGGGTGQISWHSIFLPKGGTATRVSFTSVFDVTSDGLTNGLDINLTYEGTGTCDIYSTKVMVVRNSRAYT